MLHWQSIVCQWLAVLRKHLRSCPAHITTTKEVRNGEKTTHFQAILVFKESKKNLLQLTQNTKMN